MGWAVHLYHKSRIQNTLYGAHQLVIVHVSRQQRCIQIVKSVSLHFHVHVLYLFKLLITSRGFDIYHIEPLLALIYRGIIVFKHAVQVASWYLYFKTNFRWYSRTIGKIYFFFFFPLCWIEKGECYNPCQICFIFFPSSVSHCEHYPSLPASWPNRKWDEIPAN